MTQNVSLVTGGAGFIGSHVADHLLAMGHRVVILDDLSGGFVSNVPVGAELIVGSITDPALLRRLFGEHRFNFVFHLAAYAAEGLSHFIRRFNYENNVVGSVNLINAAVNSGTVERFVFTSSIAVYGSDEPPPFSELDRPFPEDPYGIAKLAVEMDLQAARRLFGLSYTVFRPHNVYGPRQNTGDLYRNVIGIFMKQVAERRPMTIFGDGEQTRAFTYIDDVAPVIASSATDERMTNKIFNIGSDERHTVLEVAHLVARSFGVTPDIDYLPERREVTHAWASHTGLRNAIGYAPKVSLHYGIPSMVAYVAEHGVRSSRPFEAVEITKNLPPSWARLVEVRDGA